MSMVIVQLVDNGAFFVKSSFVPTLVDVLKPKEYYIINAMGTWAPLPDGEYALWE